MGHKIKKLTHKSMEFGDHFTPHTLDQLPVQKQYENTIRHPVQDIQKQFTLFGEQAKWDRIANIYGSGLVMKMKIEREMIGGVGRLPGEPFPTLGMDILTGKIDRIEFDDCLGLDNPLKPTPNVHKLVMEDKI